MNKKKSLRNSRNKSRYDSQFSITERNKFRKRARHLKLCPNDNQAKEAWS